MLVVGHGNLPPADEQRLMSLRRLLTGFATVLMLCDCDGLQTLSGMPRTALAIPQNLGRHHTFHYTGGRQSFTVPAGVTSIKIVALGAGGYPATSTTQSGRGGRVFAIVPVQPEEKLYVYVGGAGYRNKYERYKGGFNGGADGGPFGGLGCGGASDVREGGIQLVDRIVVAAGGGAAGGGRGYDNNGGDGGGYIGAPGQGPDAPYGGGGAGGGTQTAGGAGGAGAKWYGRRFRGASGDHGHFGQGGKGGAGGLGSTSSSNGAPGGGGGGGYFGGGGGGGGFGGRQATPGGGGSSYVEANAQRAKTWTGWKTATGNGLVVISW